MQIASFDLMRKYQQQIRWGEKDMLKKHVYRLSSIMFSKCEKSLRKYIEIDWVTHMGLKLSSYLSFFLNWKNKKKLFSKGIFSN